VAKKSSSYYIKSGFAHKALLEHKVLRVKHKVIKIVSSFYRNASSNSHNTRKESKPEEHLMTELQVNNDSFDARKAFVKDTLVSYYLEQQAMARHHEVQRTSMTTIFCTLAVAVVGLMGVLLQIRGRFDSVFLFFETRRSKPCTFSARLSVISAKL
jgi:hypothetical protein